MEILWKDRRRPFLGLPLSFCTYELSEERLFINEGLFNSVENEVRLYRILDLKVTRSLWQKLFRLGTVHVISSDKSMKEFQLRDIKNPRDVKEQISELVEKQRELKRVSSREYMAVGEVDEDDDPEQST